LGILIPDDATSHKEIKKRIAMGEEAFTKRKALLKGGLNGDIKKRMVKALNVASRCTERRRGR